MPEFRPATQLSALNGRNGFQLSGEAATDNSGFSVASAGDVNGDGFDDVIIGARGADPNGQQSGAAYVVFGTGAGFGSIIELSNLNGANGFQLSGEAADDYSGSSVASAGDVNGDGYDDVIIGANQADANGRNTGASYVVFGKAGGFPSTMQLSSLDGAAGFQISGENGSDYSGTSVASAGDINGDGFADVIVGAPASGSYSSQFGASYVIFGKASGFASNLQLSSLDGIDGFKLNGAAIYDGSGRSVASAGDVNGDGFDDMIIGSPGQAVSSPFGTSHVVFGKASGFAASFDLSDLDGSNGFTLTGEAASDYSGTSVASAGDINGDGFADVIVGAPLANASGTVSGASYVVFGKAGSFAANLQLSSLDGGNGFQISGEQAGDESGVAVASAGDVNGDGYDDMMIGAWTASATSYDERGISYVVFGKAGQFAQNFRLSGLDGANGFQINGEATLDRSGYSAATAGDVNGDGFADVIVGAWGADPNGRASGASYIVFGHRAQDAVTRVGTDLDNVINGGRGNDTIKGLPGNDRLIAWEGNDLVMGGNGRDRLNGRMGDDRLIGGAGRDLLIGGSGNDIFDFNSVTDSGVTDETRDIIRDFAHLEDKIDLSDIGTLTFIGTAAFTAPGQVRVVQQGPNTIVEINLSGDAAPEMTILLQDAAAASLTSADFIL